MAMAKDPVCGMDCDPKTADKVEYAGQTFYFCNRSCKESFQKDPERYIHSAQGHAHMEHEHEHHGHHH